MLVHTDEGEIEVCGGLDAALLAVGIVVAGASGACANIGLVDAGRSV